MRCQVRLLGDGQLQDTILYGKQTTSNPAAVRVVVPLSVLLTWLAHACLSESYHSNRIVVPRPHYRDPCYHVSIQRNTEGKVVPLPNSSERATLTFTELKLHDDITHLAVSMLEIDLDYDVCCKRVVFHTIPGDENAWGMAIREIGHKVRDIKIGQYANLKTYWPQLPDNWCELKDSNSLPVVVWVKPVKKQQMDRQQTVRRTAQTARRIARSDEPRPSPTGALPGHHWW